MLEFTKLLAAASNRQTLPTRARPAVLEDEVVTESQIEVDSSLS